MTIVVVNDSYKCVGFSMRSGFCTPHFCSPLLHDAKGNLYERVFHADDRARSLSPRELDVLKDKYLFLTPEQI